MFCLFSVLPYAPSAVWCGAGWIGWLDTVFLLIPGPQAPELLRSSSQAPDSRLPRTKKTVGCRAASVLYLPGLIPACSPFSQ